YKVSGFGPDFSINCCTWNGEMVIWGPDAGLHNSVDARELTKMEIDTRLSVYRHFAEMKKKDPALADATITETGPLLGIRQTRFIKGEYVITGQDVLEGKMPEDSIAMAANPVIHYYGYRRFLTHDGYGIGYKTLVPEALDGVLIAGRCISSDQIAYESWRAMSTVLCIGEAAGTAAALCAQKDVRPRDLDVPALQAQLIAQGAEIGQGKKK
ncbi:MAG: FAD-dependent oxidoreductase, partial [Oscillospiraceae bacterium]|nr:FAD-dependent oxidoreductase [Oscillospiraceae bacterium]